jgi:hypothetical protein
MENRAQYLSLHTPKILFTQKMNKWMRKEKFICIKITMLVTTTRECYIKEVD